MSCRVSFLHRQRVGLRSTCVPRIAYGTTRNEETGKQMLVVSLSGDQTFVTQKPGVLNNVEMRVFFYQAINTNIMKDDV